jgi:hypothetical protein
MGVEQDYWRSGKLRDGRMRPSRVQAVRQQLASEHRHTLLLCGFCRPIVAHNLPLAMVCVAGESIQVLAPCTFCLETDVCSLYEVTKAMETG